MLEIKTDKPEKFNNFILGEIKKSLREKASLFNPSFYFKNKEYTLEQCINSIYCRKGVIKFRLLYPIKHLVYNQRQLYWVGILSYYRINMNRLYLLWNVNHKMR